MNNFDENQMKISNHIDNLNIFYISLTFCFNVPFIKPHFPWTMARLILHLQVWQIELQLFSSCYQTVHKSFLNLVVSCHNPESLSWRLTDNCPLVVWVKLNNPVISFCWSVDVCPVTVAWDCCNCFTFGGNVMTEN